MERFLTAFVLGLCTAPLVFIMTLIVIDHLNSANPGQSPGLSESLLVGGVAWFLAGQGYLRPVQTVTGLMLAG
ncbi:hypothetical protein [Spirosoma spitsbergense]|uniref:hypothetical protein n=1 Tax=Spirosoma spitsbergense TaxID=431554 RepID=UPI000366E4F3|nr:hypothetical protein [Spirosoma spitsbergense]